MLQRPDSSPWAALAYRPKIIQMKVHIVTVPGAVTAILEKTGRMRTTDAMAMAEIITAVLIVAAGAVTEDNQKGHLPMSFFDVIYFFSATLSSKNHFLESSSYVPSLMTFFKARFTSSASF